MTTERASDTIVTRSNPAKDVYHLLAVVVAVVTIAALYFARVVLIPFALAVLFTFILTPVVRLLERAHLGRAFSSLLVVLLTLGTCAGLGWGVSKQFGQVVNRTAVIQAEHQGKAGLAALVREPCATQRVRDGNRD